MGKSAAFTPPCPEPLYHGGTVREKTLDSDYIDWLRRTESERAEIRRKQAEEHAKQWWDLLVFGLYVTASGVVGVLVAMAYVIISLDTPPFRTGGWF